MAQKKHIKNAPPKHAMAKQPPLSVFQPNIWLAFTVAFAGILLYANTLNHGYVLDDGMVTFGNEYVLQGLKGIPQILKIELFHFANIHLGYYRPLSMISFAVENQFFGNDPHVYHLGNILLYGLTGFFLCMFLMRFFKTYHPLLACVISLLFIAHPIHTEVVANIKSRDEILSFLNMVISFILLMKAYETPLKNKLHLAFSFFFFYLAVLSKETAMVGLVIIPLILYYGKNNTIQQSLLRSVPFIIVFCLFLFQKNTALGYLTPPDMPKADIVNYPYAHAHAELPAVFLIFLWCIKLVFLPHPLAYDYSYNQIPAPQLSSFWVWLGILLLLTLAVIGLAGLKKRTPLSLSILLFFVTLAPALAFIYLRGGILAERFLYAPVLGFSMVMVFLLAHVLKVNFRDPDFTMGQIKKYFGFASVLILVLGLYSFKTISRNSDWKDMATLLGEDVKVSSNSFQVRKHYGNELINSAEAENDKDRKRIMFDEGVKQLQEALKIYPGQADAFFKLGFAYQQVEVNNDSAIYYYSKAIQAWPDYTIAYNNMGLIYESMGKEELASYFYNKSIEKDPPLAEGLANHEKHKQRTGLDVHIFPSQLDMEAIEKNTENRDAKYFYTLGTEQALKGDYIGGVKCFEKARELDPTQEVVYINLSNCYGMIGKYKENIDILTKLLQINPNSAQAYNNLAITYNLIGDKAKAEECRRKGIQLSGK